MRKSPVLLVLVCILLLLSGCVQNTQNTQKMQKQNLNQNRSSNITTPEYSAIVSSESVNVSKLKCNLSLIRDIDEFSFRMMNSLGNGNQFFSPISIEFAFATLGEGAGGKTRLEIFKALNIPTSDTLRRTGFACLYSRLEKSGNFTLANALWIQEGYPVKRSYVDVIRNYYPAELYHVNFKQGGVAKLINGWVSRKTHGKIRSIVSKIDPSTRLAITNAVYFKGEWVKKFYKARPIDFHSPSGIKKVDAMKVLSYYPYSEYGGFRAVEIPYRGNFSMLVVMPENCTSLPRINYSTFETLIAQENTSYVEIYMPKFELKTQYDLRGVMERLGITLAFTPQANFSGISDERLCVGQAFHKAYVKVDENGTVAAAATYIGVVATAIPPQNHIVFKVDRPFYFFILENIDGYRLVLFAGKVERI